MQTPCQGGPRGVQTQSYGVTGPCWPPTRTAPALIKKGRLPAGWGGDSGDIVSSLRLVPKFNERDVDMFFDLFERVADARNLSDADRIVLLQCVLTGRTQEAFSSLPAPDIGDYSKVKAAVLKSYELVPEAYRQRFRSWRKGDKSHLEFARELGTHFHR